MSIPLDENPATETSLIRAPANKEGDKEGDLEALKAALNKAKESQKELDARIRDLLAQNGITIHPGERVTIGVSGDRIGVTMDDKEKAKEIERILNGDKKLAKEIHKNQHVQGVAAQALKNALPDNTSLRHLAQIAFEGPGPQSLVPEGMTDQEYQNLAFISLFADNPDILESFKELYAPSDISTSRENNYIVTPESTLKDLGRNAMTGITEAVSEYNRQLHLSWGSDLEEIEKRLVSLRDVKLFMDGNGMVTTEGSFGKSRHADNAGKAIVEDILTSVFESYKNEHGESLFKRAADRMVDLHDEEYGDVGHHPHTAMIRILNGQVSTWVSSPEAEKEIEGEIQTEVNAMLHDEGVKLEYELTITVDERGRIVADNLPENALQAEKVESLLDSLSRLIDVETSKKGTSTSEPPCKNDLSDTAKRLAPLMRHLAAHRPDGEKWFRRRAHQR